MMAAPEGFTEVPKMFVARSLKTALVLAIVVAARFAFGSGGGDNDSPFNLPNNSSGGGGGSTELVAGLQPVHVAFVPGATLTTVASDLGLNGSRAIIEHADVVTNAASNTKASARAPFDVLTPMPNTDVKVREIDGEAQVSGRFRLKTGLAVRLAAEPGTPARHALLLLGTLSPSGTSLVDVFQTQQLALSDSGIALADLSHMIAGQPGLTGIGVQVVLLRGTSQFPLATALFAVQAQPTYFIDTLPNQPH